MPLRHAYVTQNLLPNTPASYTWAGANSPGADRLCDGRLDRLFVDNARIGGTHLTVDLGVAQSIDTAAVLNSNVSEMPGATLEVIGADDSAMTVNVVTLRNASPLATTPPRHKDHVLRSDLTPARRYWRFVWSWPPPWMFALRVGEIVLGRSTVLSRAVVYGTTQRLEVVKTENRTYAGGRRSHFVAGPIRSRELSFAELATEEEAELVAMWLATLGGVRPLLWIEDAGDDTDAPAPPETQDCLFGLIEEGVLTSTEADFGLYNPSGMTIRSLGREVGS